MTRRPANARGFSLLELLVALAMMAVLAGSLYATLQIAFRARRSSQASIEPVRRAEIVLSLLRADFQSAMVPRGVLAGVFLGEDEADVSGGIGDSVSMYCAASGGESDEQVGDVRLIEFYCEPSADGSAMTLLRRVVVNPLASATDDAPIETLCRNLAGFDLRYFDGWDWQDQWDSVVQNDSLPVAVEVTLQLQPPPKSPPDAEGYLTSQVFLIPCGVPTSQGDE
ncbi:hypothetical protein LCGC14_0467590 [marine sediment metagenome]|uniref:Type II secretion system protein J n=1 Tax=marine sediment metagenome TaxID=412755 RepID=A0A0F9SIH0_9ZZZZ|nr:prepilin-type N-terminal cleavage/methylation domain-containing protein [Phycisphaerae bacterium]HDZ44332.1 prepilin-type N-terminal cleavage/methylation domain-containing protein [Phycisphaerae bacterium]